MSDSFRDVKTRSWFSRLSNSAGGVIVGFLLILAMVVLLFWNEGRAVTTAKSLAEGSSVVVPVSSATVDPANEGKLVHTTGRSATTATPSDDAFAVSAPGLRLVRSVEMYQWTEESKSETQKKLGGGEETVTTYTYGKDWDDSPIDSSDFRQPSGHGNPGMEIRSQRFQVPEATLGAFKLGPSVIDGVGGEKDLVLKNDQADAIRAAFGGTAKVSVVDGRIYLGRNPTAPAVGDYRIRYQVAPAGDLSIVGKQSGSGFERYATKAGDQLLMVTTGIAPAEKMFAEAVSENTLITWVLRGVGMVVLFIGFSLLMAPIGVIADVIPLLGSIVRLGTGTLAFVLALLVGLVTIAVAWFWYRPLLSVALVAFALLVAVALAFFGRRQTVGQTSPTSLPSVPRGASTRPSQRASRW